PPATGPGGRALAEAGAGRRRGPNSVVRLGVVGVKGRGLNHVQDYAKMKDVRVAAICDVDENVIGAAMKAAEEGAGRAPAYHRDFRKLLEDKTLDGVSIATCNHTHSLIALSALAAGKHVYVEKPLSHNVREGAALAAGAKATGLVVQHGTQSRSSPGLQEMVAYLRSGALGPLTAVRAFCYKRRTSIGKQPPAPVPQGVDYDLWLGPAPVRPFTRNRFHYNWHWHWDYGNGDIGNQGVHEMDRARWGLGATGHPARIMSVGGRLGYEDDGETPNTLITLFDWGAVPLLFEVRGLETDEYRGCRIGVIYDCRDGYVVNPNYESATVFDKNGKQLKTFGG
ncbi:MAG: Gfo/Idh/MocA family oxidoreductase, partial [bacterium]